jgi:hypothetical protein
MNIKSSISIAAAILIFAPVAFACDYPNRAKIPNGATASTEQMLAGQKSVKEYMAAMDEYLACIDSEEKEAIESADGANDEELARRKVTTDKKYNAAVDEMELLAAQFNEEVRAYKAAQAD